jgi:hypothetical protein
MGAHCFCFLECEMEDEAEFADTCDEAGGSKEPGRVLRFGMRNGLGRLLDFLHDRRSEVRGGVFLSRCNPEVEFVIRRRGHGSVMFESGFEKLTGAADAGLDGADGGGFDLGGFGVGEVFEGNEGEGALLLSGELMKGFVEHSQAVPAPGFRGVGVLLGKFSQESRALLPKGVERAAAGDHEQPRGESTSRGIEMLETAKGFHEDDLREVFGVTSFVIQKRGNHPEQAILVMKDEMLKGLDLPVHNASDDLEFVGFVHALFRDDTGGGRNGSIFCSQTQKGFRTAV